MSNTETQAANEAALRDMVAQAATGPVAAAYHAAVEVARSLPISEAEADHAGDPHCWPKLCVADADPIQCVIDTVNHLAPFLRQHGYANPPETLYRQAARLQLHDENPNAFRALPARVRIAWTVFQTVLGLADAETAAAMAAQQREKEAKAREQERAARRIDPEDDMLATHDEPLAMTDLGKRIARTSRKPRKQAKAADTKSKA